MTERARGSGDADRYAGRLGAAAHHVRGCRSIRRGRRRNDNPLTTALVTP